MKRECVQTSLNVRPEPRKSSIVRTLSLKWNKQDRAPCTQVAAQQVSGITSVLRSDVSQK